MLPCWHCSYYPASGLQCPTNSRLAIAMLACAKASSKACVDPLHFNDCYADE